METKIPEGVFTERRKKLAEPILHHLLTEAEHPVEAMMTLMLCLTEIIARSIESQNPREIAARMKDVTQGWIGCLAGGESDEQDKPVILQ
jgi:hypothetical protein